MAVWRTARAELEEMFQVELTTFELQDSVDKRVGYLLTTVTPHLT